MKTLLVTGGTGQLGQAMLERLSRDYRCVVVTRTEFPKVDRLYGILHLAGAFTVGSAPDDFMKMLDANLMSAVRVIEPMREKIEDGGRIIGISSLASQTTPAALAAYVSAKAALNAYIGVLAKGLQPRRITANALLPRRGNRCLSAERRRRVDHRAADRNDPLTCLSPQNVSTSHCRNSPAGLGLLIQ